ncbi:hypothetical protein NPIL_221311 [Nephila pilipes]|uniref:Uncharacterized protein n=1 Tax=Nephila pilipes TaxID=299642 RepID=A0A8X6UT97_NEPPI|nr:hypothetical protein NPIL_221311 [Nephila pilipes]
MIRTGSRMAYANPHTQRGDEMITRTENPTLSEPLICKMLILSHECLGDGWCYTRCDNTDSLWVLIDAFAILVTPTNEYIGCDLPVTSGAPSIKMDHVNCVGWNESAILLCRVLFHPLFW